MLTKILRKFQPNFQNYVKKIEAWSKKQFSYKKTCKKLEKQKMNKKSTLFKKFLELNLLLGFFMKTARRETPSPI